MTKRGPIDTGAGGVRNRKSRRATGVHDLGIDFRSVVRDFELGRLREAEAGATRIRARAPRDFDVNFLSGLIALRLGKFEEAARLISHAIGIRGDNPDSHANLAVAYLGAGRIDKGIASLRQTLKLAPQHADAHFNLGLALLQGQDPTAAVPHLQAAVRLMPANPIAHMNLGLALAGTAGPEEALEHFQRAADLAPTNAVVHLNLSNVLLDLGNVERALGEAEAAVRLDPRFPAAHCARAQALNRANRGLLAIGAYQQAIKIDPGYAPAHNALGGLYQKRGQYVDAEAHLRKAFHLHPGDDEYALDLARILALLARLPEAVEVCRTLEAEKPEAPESYRAHAEMLLQAGQFDEAREILSRLRKVNPDPAGYFDLMAQDRSREIDDEDLAAAKTRILDPAITSPEKVRLCFSVASVLDRRRDFDGAFDYYCQGNSIRNAESDYDFEDISDHFRRLTETFDESFFDARKNIGVADDKPVFIVGMPRSGTSLVEQILASHPEVAGGGERDDMNVLADDLADMLGGTTPYPECTVGIDGKLAHHLACDYLAKDSDQSGSARRVTDKMPANFLHLGVIALLFPGARVIHCTRDPMAICFSIFTQTFAGRTSYAYNMDRLGHFYGLYVRLMDHWRKVCPLPMLDVQYADLIADQEGKSREIIEFCGLDWDDGILDFHKTRRPVRTASLWQVRQPIYTSAIDRWRSFERHLAPLKAALEKAGVFLGPK